jgi:hypothetical protein
VARFLYCCYGVSQDRTSIIPHDGCFLFDLSD